MEWLRIPLASATDYDPRLSEFADEPHVRAAFLTHDWVYAVLLWPPLVGALCVLLLSLRRPGRWVPGPLLAQFGFLATGALWFAGGMLLQNNWHIAAERVALDGRRYAVLSRAMLDDFEEVLCRPSEPDLLRTRYDALVSVGVPGLRTASMIRPGTDGAANLSFGADGHTAAVRDGACRWLYDARDGTALSGDDLARVSPFVLLGDSTPGSEDDLASIATRIAHPDQGDDPKVRFLLAHPDAAGAGKVNHFDEYVDLPTEASLLAALDSANPWIRSAAKRLVEAGGADTYPEATQRISGKK